ncbi:MAG: hypothetical protein GY906_04860 [bacterium]|nr:hypothetical protein [bacterium]
MAQKHYRRKSDRNKPDPRSLQLIGNDLADQMVRKYPGQALPTDLFKSPSFRGFIKGRGYDSDQVTAIKDGYTKRYTQLRG